MFLVAGRPNAAPSSSSTRLGFLPSDVEAVGGALLLSQTQPVAAIRRIDPERDRDDAPALSTVYGYPYA